MREYRQKSVRLAIVLLLALCFAGTRQAAAQTGWDHYQKALQLQKEEKTSEAIKELTYAVEKEPGNAFYQNALGLAYIDVAKYEEAFDYLQKASELDPKLADAYSGLGVCHNAKGEYEKSIEMFKKALDITPENSPDLAVIHNNIGQNYYLLKAYDEAEKELRAAISMNDKLLTAYVNLGNVYTERNDYANAVVYHEKAVQLAPDYSLPRNNLAFAYYKLGRFDDALSEMDKVVKTDPQNEQFKRNYDFLKFEKEKKEKNTYAEGPLKGLPKEVELRPKAEREAEVATVAAAIEPTTEPAAAPAAVASEPAAVAQAPNTEPAETPAAEKPAPYVRKSGSTENKPAPPKTSEPAAATQKSEPQPQPERQAPRPRVNPAPENEAPQQQAAQAPTPAQTPKPQSSEYNRKKHKTSGLTREQKEEALRLETLALMEQRAADYFRAAKYNLSINDLENAEGDIIHALEIHPLNPDYLTVRAMIEERRGNYHQAAAEYRNVIEKAPGHSAAINSLGYTNQMLKRPEMAKESFQRALDADETNGCAAGNLGSIKVLYGDCEGGMELLTKAVEKQCIKAGVLNNISLCYFEKGDFDNAQELARRALSLEPNNPTITSNFSYIIEKSGLDFNPVHVPRDSEIDPYYKKSGALTDVDLNKLTPVAALDFYDVYRSNYHKRTVLVLPFEHLPGTERWRPTPAETLTKQFVNSIAGNGYFNVIVPQEDLSFTSFQEKTNGAYIQKMLKKYPADIVYIGKVGRQRVSDKINTRYKGLKKKDYVEVTYPVETQIFLVDKKEKLYDGELSGIGYQEGAISATLPYRTVNDIKSRAFDDYCVRVSNVILDYFHLVKLPVRRDVVKRSNRQLTKLAQFWR